MIRLTKEQFIEKSNEKFGINSFDFYETIWEHDWNKMKKDWFLNKSKQNA